jgi:20S proteasome alpha/beta subunit
MRIGNRLLLIVLIIGSVESRGSTSRVFSPVSELGPSLAASVAGGTIIAARSPRSLHSKQHGDAVSTTKVEVNNVEDDECLVILFRSPVAVGSGEKQLDGNNLTISSVFGIHADDDDSVDNEQQQVQSNRYHGLSFLSNGPVNFPFLPSSSSNNVRILHAPSGLLMAATGFAPDADYILNVAAGRIFSRISIYDTPSSLSKSSTKSVDPHRLVREDLAPMMMDATMSGGGRPFGVQLLVVGQSTLSRQSSNDCPLEIYTIDPSGGWRSCIGSGTAVGRGAEKVRVLLRESHRLEIDEDTSVGPNNTPLGWRGALDIAMMAAIEAMEQDENSDDDSDPQGRRSRANFGAIVVFSGTGQLRSQVSHSRCALVNSIVTMKSYDRCHQRLTEKQTSAKGKSV